VNDRITIGDPLLLHGVQISNHSGEIYRYFHAMRFSCRKVMLFRNVSTCKLFVAVLHSLNDILPNSLDAEYDARLHVTIKHEMKDITRPNRCAR